MEYRKTIILKDGRACILRNASEQDGKAVLDIYILTHSETDYLLSYADESGMTEEKEAQYLKEKAESSNEVELLAEVDGNIVGIAGIGSIGKKDKVKHRASYGISVAKDWWGLGIGRGLTEACIACARIAGYAQLELDVVAENRNAMALYESMGFTEYGRNPKGFRSRFSGWQELVLMRLELDR